tara:strand:+ start:4795 stop:5460 length:666 start_codon:yes stop_codon:yes gene_type:complete
MFSKNNIYLGLLLLITAIVALIIAIFWHQPPKHKQVIPAIKPAYTIHIDGIGEPIASVIKTHPSLFELESNDNKYQFYIIQKKTFLLRYGRTKKSSVMFPPAIFMQLSATNNQIDDAVFDLAEPDASEQTTKLKLLNIHKNLITAGWSSIIPHSKYEAVVNYSFALVEQAHMSTSMKINTYQHNDVCLTTTAYSQYTSQRAKPTFSIEINIEKSLKGKCDT